MHLLLAGNTNEFGYKIYAEIASNMPFYIKKTTRHLND
ncbi:hypothetical protein yberc0001_8020 [Yersinia bercovieri ATCC 43970]|uniref:Uncharacterized protein n=1 Tax=Yersinia bercovieri ATCC 43970 TaxID=349968 RepID=A0ABP2DXK2_YERBE|nr:hypothetical protein yberc0001_8020 [Yersinia bercovieri ATCC 43970]